MPNAPLRRGCPLCSGTGTVAYVRHAQWLNDHCTDRNGPLDSDDYPDGVEVDFLARRRWARVEFKHAREPMRHGQITHLAALHQGMSASGWDVLLLVVYDEGQQEAGAQVRFRWTSSQSAWTAPETWPEHLTTLDALGRSIADWMWRGGLRPVFACPAPPACVACGAVLPRTPQQTMPVRGRNSWVCAACFRRHFGVKVA